MCASAHQVPQHSKRFCKHATPCRVLHQALLAHLSPAAHGCAACSLMSAPHASAQPQHAFQWHAPTGSAALTPACPPAQVKYIKGDFQDPNLFFEVPITSATQREIVRHYLKKVSRRATDGCTTRQLASALAWAGVPVGQGCWCAGMCRCWLSCNAGLKSRGRCEVLCCRCSVHEHVYSITVLDEAQGSMQLGHRACTRLVPRVLTCACAACCAER
jgi:hypothetical protein